MTAHKSQTLSQTESLYETHLSTHSIKAHNTHANVHNNDPFTHESELRIAHDYLSRACMHEFREPLRNAANFIQLLIGHNQFDAQSLQFASNLHRSINRMHTLTKSLTSYLALFESQTPIITVIDMNNLITSIQKIFQEQLLEKEGTVSINLLPTIEGVYSQIYQLFFHLLDNAIKFCDQKPLMINIFAHEDEQTITFHVRDNGIGIEQQYHDAIFNMFNRLHHREAYEGFGTGLAICREIVRKHHGTISVQSIPGKGSTFTVAIPKRYS